MCARIFTLLEAVSFSGATITASVALWDKAISLEFFLEATRPLAAPIANKNSYRDQTVIGTQPLHERTDHDPSSG